MAYCNETRLSLEGTGIFSEASDFEGPTSEDTDEERERIKDSEREIDVQKEVEHISSEESSEEDELMHRPKRKRRGYKGIRIDKKSFLITMKSINFINDTSRENLDVVNNSTISNYLLDII